ncbi:endonuclease/exonuclease/phosphatase family protein [uncultured Pseudokineococcus sp.]|uniref:endonuclease/exonuclease/phosphatase family protein n=1 Tax=uncultured Pseudokineococcus sp. TaxID=1642928 RepID=UPI0026362DDC|nr:endonuclease/exonuclease/phosphatase family protein [uncultured Pseudokineococcus sp.]
MPDAAPAQPAAARSADPSSRASASASGRPLVVATANVNGIRAAARRGMGAWLAGRGVDVLCLQEVRADDDTLRRVIAEMAGEDAPAKGAAQGDVVAGWHVAHVEPTDAGTKGRAGVAVVSRLPLAAVREDLGDADAGGRFAGAGRWLEADVALPDGRTLTAVSAYVHSGEVGTPQQDGKMAFLAAATERMAALGADDGALAVVTGDLNVGHRELDIKNWKGNRKKAGFLPEERAALDRWFRAPDDHGAGGEGAADAGGPGLGWTDVARALAGEVDGPYSWWSWRGQAFDNDTGWRIDYQVATPALGAAARTCEVDRVPSYAERWSDHAPVVATYAL